ncbi:DUF2333 family protein [Marinivivus vitaminiproducens]|uniref:DUF2333 family protein n=1 Tax=Marinivivus vitaminiproducens TaxID=3035935 RepID=UPI0027A36BB3|nr:DUF2333 family protein [Geminicoccaceae bacterium SCSIO 64248]
MADATLHPAERTRPGWLRRLGQAVGVLVCLIALYYVGGALWLHTIDDDPTFAETLEVPPGSSRAVAAMTDLIDREVNQNRWVANDPFFQPAYILDNMPNYQLGMMSALSRISLELGDRIARVRSTSQIDPDIDSAAGRLRYPGDVWLFTWQNSFLPVPTTSSERTYRDAMASLQRYNQRLSQNQATFERRADNLLETLDRLAADLGSISATSAAKVADRSWFDFDSDDVFYLTKGRMYAYFIVLRELGRDFEQVLAERQLQPAWDAMIDNLRTAALLQPWVVVNGAPDSQTMPSHVASQGFYVARARTQLSEVSQVLAN